MRTIWRGSSSSGLVSTPIGWAVAPQRSDIAFRTLHRECGTPIKNKRWCPFHERDVEAEELVKGWEVAKDRKSTRLNSSHLVISYAVFCLKKKKRLDELELSADRVFCA